MPVIQKQQYRRITTKIETKKENGKKEATPSRERPNLSQLASLSAGHRLRPEVSRETPTESLLAGYLSFIDNTSKTKQNIATVPR